TRAALRVRHNFAEAVSICSNPAAIPAIHSNIRAVLPSIPRSAAGAGALAGAGACRAAVTPPAGAAAVAAVAWNTSPASAPSTSVLFSVALASIGHADAVQFTILFSLLLGCLDHLRHPVQFLPRQPRGRNVQ